MASQNAPETLTVLNYRNSSCRVPAAKARRARAAVVEREDPNDATSPEVVVVPARKASPATEAHEFPPGISKIDAAHLRRMRERSPIVDAWFGPQGWLRIVPAGTQDIRRGRVQAAADSIESVVIARAQERPAG